MGDVGALKSPGLTDQDQKFCFMGAEVSTPGPPLSEKPSQEGE